MVRNIFAIFAVLFLSSPVWAVCPQQEATVVFVNGVWTTDSEAEQHKIALEREVRKEGISSDCVHFTYSHTQDDGKAADIAEAIVQKSTEFTVAFSQLVRMFLRLITPDAIFGEVIDAAYDRNVGEVVDAQLDKHVARVRELALERGHRAVVVTHSQGGLYGNALWHRLTATEQAETRLITVATPARDTADGGPNTRLTRDGVANRYFLAASVAGMIPNTGLCETEEAEEANSWLCHGFETGYLHDAGARAQIVADITDALPVPSRAEYLVFTEGDPGVPGDGILITSGGTAHGGKRFEFQAHIPLQSVAQDGFTLTTFLGPLPPVSGVYSMSVLVRSQSSLPGCTGTLFAAGKAPRDVMILHGVIGFISYFNPEYVARMVRAANSFRTGCGFQLQDLFAWGITMFYGSVQIEQLDAVAFGLGPDGFPVE